MNAISAQPICDPSLPQLAQALDLGAMTARLETLINADTGGATAWRINACDIERVKYKPGRHCLLCYHLTLESDAGERRYEQRICGRIYPPRASRSRYARARAQFGRHASAPVVHHLPDLEMVLWRFPADRKLAALSIFDDAEVLNRDILPDLLRMRWWNQYRVRGLQHSIAHYAPEHSCSVRLQLDLQDRLGKHRDWTLFGKIYYDDGGARTHANMRALSVMSDRFQHLTTATALHYDADRKLLWQEGLNGIDLHRRQALTRHGDWVLAAAAAALSELHGCDLPQLPHITVTDDLEILQQRCALLSAYRPALAGRCEKLLQALSASAPAAPLAATLHGDLHPKNMLLDRGRIALIDLDGLGRGAAARDLGAWLAGNACRSLLAGATLRPDWARRDPLVKHYLRCVRAQPGQREIDWYTAIALINERAYRCVSRMKTGRAGLIETLLDHAEVLAGRLRLAA